MINHDQAIFDAIAAATDHNDDGIFVDVQKFIDTFNSHRDRKLCTSLDVAQTERRIEALEAALREAIPCLEEQGYLPEAKRARAALAPKPPVYEAMEAALEMGKPGVERMVAAVAQTPPDQFMDDYKRDTTNAMAARILELEAALREIDNMAPATCEVTLAHQMADIASAALAPPRKD